MKHTSATTTNIQDVLKLIRKGESEFLESKSSLSDLNRIVEEVCGFVNASGGFITIGVNEKGELKE